MTGVDPRTAIRHAVWHERVREHEAAQLEGVARYAMFCAPFTSADHDDAPVPSWVDPDNPSGHMTMGEYLDMIGTNSEGR